MAITSLSTSSLVSGVKRRRVWDQTATTDGFFQIATTTLNVTAASITFSSIPQGYTHLQVRYIARATVNDNTYMRFNGDTGANYSGHYIYGQGASAASGSIVNGTSFYTDVLTGSATSYNNAVVDILDYANTNKYKTIRSLGGSEFNNTDGSAFMNSGHWRSGSAISTIRIFPGADSFGIYSSFALYGVKA